MRKHGKKYQAAAKLVDRDKIYSVPEAVSLLQKTAYTKFDSTIEVHMRMGIDPKQADQLVRGVVSLPNGTGKTVRIAVFADGEGATLAQEAGADVSAATTSSSASPKASSISMWRSRCPRSWARSAAWVRCSARAA